jgi:acyl CoA:acetate/3-ketoacid CoA transferase
MTVDYSSKFRDITAAIADLTVSGVTFFDVDNIPANANLLAKVVYPTKITDFKSKTQTFGLSGQRSIDFTYNINYTYIHCTPQASVGGFSEIYTDLIESIFAIVAAISTCDLDDTDLGITSDETIAEFPAKVQDLSGNEFWGYSFKVSVTEYKG